MRRPSHHCTFHEPDGRIIYDSVTYPVGKLRARLYCKYCYTTHADWYLMAKQDYGDHTVVLCGRCEYTSMLMLIDNVNESQRALRIIRHEPPVACGRFGMIGVDPKTGEVIARYPSEPPDGSEAC